MRLFNYAVLYLQHYQAVPVFMNEAGVPLHSWRVYADEGVTLDELKKIWDEVKAKSPERIGILTGEYWSKHPRGMVIVDYDTPMDANEKKEVMKSFSKDGYLVVNTPRGFHIHAYVTPPYPYVVSLEREGKKVGEGACLLPHVWTMPPSRRPLNGTWFTYMFVYPDGTQTSSFERFASNPISPAEVNMRELEADIETYLRCKVRVYRPMTDETVKIKELDTDVGLKEPLFDTVGEFLAVAGDVVLPRCVSWILAQYFHSVGRDDLSSRILLTQLDYEELLTPVPRGMRKLVSVAFSLFMSHIVHKVKYEEIIEILSHAVEDFPHDETPLDKSLKYFFLSDSDGYLYPRYSGLGSMNLTQVLGDFCLNKCPYGRMCRGRNPWKHFRKEYKKRFLSKMLLDAGDAVAVD